MDQVKSCQHTYQNFIVLPKTLSYMSARRRKEGGEREREKLNWNFAPLFFFVVMDIYLLINQLYDLFGLESNALYRVWVHFVD